MTALLLKIVDFIDEQLVTVPALDSSSMDAYSKTRAAVTAAEARVRNVLAHRFAARITAASDVTAVSIHGIRSTSTTGMQGALRNWQTAARRRLEKAGA